MRRELEQFLKTLNHLMAPNQVIPPPLRFRGAARSAMQRIGPMKPGGVPQRSGWADLAHRRPSFRALRPALRPSCGATAPPRQTRLAGEREMTVK